MIEVSNEQFQQLIDEALGTLPKEHLAALKNVAILYEQEPTQEQRQVLHLRCDMTLFGLYEGIPLPQRGGNPRPVPDRITIFKGPICQHVNSLAELQEEIRHTLWHEIAHYYGLGHGRIHELEGKQPPA